MNYEKQCFNQRTTKFKRQKRDLKRGVLDTKIEKGKQNRKGGGKMRVLAADLGYSSVKVAGTGAKPFKFPSAVALKPQLGSVASKMESYNFGGLDYLVGEEALRFSSGVGGRSEDFSVAFAPLLIAKAVEEMRKRIGRDYTPDILVVSVAVDEYSKEITVPLPEGGKESGIKSELLEKRLREFEVNGEKFKFEEVVVLPQGKGIWIDIGEPEDALIIDIGFNTTDVLRIEDGKIVYSTGGKVGVLNLASYLKDYLANQGVKVGDKVVKLEISTEKAEKAIRERYLKVRGEKIPLEEIIPIETLKNLLISRVFGIIEENRALITALDELGEVVVAGGGGYFVPENFKGYRIRIPSEPEFSNVRGFLKFVENQL